MGLLVAILDRLLSWFVLFVARGEIKEIKQILSDKNDEVIAKEDANNLKKAQTDEERALAIKKIIDNSFRSSKR